MPTLQSEGMFSLNSVGWHKCNDRYRLQRPDGFEHHLLIITVSGCGEMKINDTHYSLPAGTVALIPRDVPHSYGTPDNGLWEFYWLHPSGELSNKFLDSVAQRGIYVQKIDNHNNYSGHFERLITICTEHAYGAALYISKEVSTLLHMAATDLYAKPRSVSLSADVIAYIEQHYMESLKLEDLAYSLFVSVAHLIRVFKQENGCTPHQYLIKYRLLTAAQLLKFSDLRVDEIAERVGFSSASHFISSFKREYGCTPTEYNH